MADIKLPELGENITSGSVTGILVKVGDTVAKGQSVLELETDKAVVEVPSPAAGVVKEIKINSGDDVSVGQVIFIFDDSGAAPAAKEAPTSTAKEESKEKPKEEPKKTAEEEPQEVATPQPATAPQPVATTKSNASIPAAHKNVNASPVVRKLARELGVDVSTINGSGPSGRISQEDVKNHVKSLMQSGNVGGGAITSKPLPDFSKFGSTRVEKMSKIRQVTGAQMSFCWNTIPHVTQFDKADITELDKLRKKVSTKDRKLTVTPFLLKVMAAALKKFPQFNASVDAANNQIIYKDYFNLGVAVDTPRGLLVPVVKNIDKKNIFELTDELNEMASRARDGKTGLAELSGGCMTLTNLGGIGGHAFTPIVNWPEVCILGVSRGGLEPVYENGNFIPRLRLPLSLSYDHRLIDGADAARFLRWICEAIEQPFLLDLE